MASYRARNEARCTSSGRTARFHAPHWYTRNPRRTLAAQYAEVTAPFWLVLILARGQGIEARLLLIVEQAIEFCERRAHDAHGLQHCGKAHTHGLDPSGWGAGQVSRAPGPEKVDRLGDGCLKLFKRRSLRLIRLDNLRNLVDAPVRHTRGLTGAEAAADLCTWAPDISRAS